MQGAEDGTGIASDDDDGGCEEPQVSTPDSSLQQQQQPQQRATAAGDDTAGSSAAHHVARQVEAVRRRVLVQYGSTGALLALTTAIAMRPPRVVFPVADLQASAGQAKGGL